MGIASFLTAKEQSWSSRGLGVKGREGSTSGALGSFKLAHGGSSPGFGHTVGGCRFPRSSSAVGRNVGVVHSPNVELTDRVVVVVEA
ncbi:hypothetical protein TIFTF001_050721 [Ficus carica]|uniref:Uncharacterized protein n=1 Tax=Ficus carica TaxID=3494 RepID=A0AA87ZC10_FICCA|nr:hypothetical protein TIFTF001_050721 [Ficus carica]